uniref:Uncharacterized protein n=1 Tax=Romanomermis culicivorax TaxID=13658 RepID=A0A915II68_ROMCU
MKSVCINGQCWPDDASRGCVFQSDCPLHYTCVYGQCKVPGDGKSYGTCSSSNQCPINHVCEKKKCYPVEQGLSVCTFDSDCYKSDLYQYVFQCHFSQILD